ncbi:MAG: hypothetical protein J5I93_09835, partial [Pirellulaceae bacterium]|nr:hypothetical protein [Pirellulaceae bacterium]
ATSKPATAQPAPEATAAPPAAAPPADLAAFASRLDNAWRLLASLGGDVSKLTSDLRRYLLDVLPIENYQLDDFVRSYGRVHVLQQLAETPERRAAARQALAEAEAAYQSEVAEIDQEIASLQARRLAAAKPVDEARQVVARHADAMGQLQSLLPNHVKERIREIHGKVRDQAGAALHAAKYRCEWLTRVLALDPDNYHQANECRDLIRKRFGQDVVKWDHDKRETVTVKAGSHLAVKHDGGFSDAAWERVCDEFLAELGPLKERVRLLETDQAAALAADVDAETRELQDFWIRTG